MSQYEQLCAACATALTTRNEARNRVDAFLESQFLPGLVEYLGCPVEHVWFFDFGGSRYEDVVLRTALEMDDDFYWNIGIVLRVDGGSRFVDFEYRLRCRDNGGHFLVDIADRKFAIEDDSSCLACYAQVVSHIAAQLRCGLADQGRDDLAWRVEMSPCGPVPLRVFGQECYDMDTKRFALAPSAACQQSATAAT